MVNAIITGTTCGEACWHAHEDVCKCSCGGKNHGALRTPNGTQPVRTRQIDGETYQLAGIGEGVFEEAQRINIASGITAYKGMLLGRYESASRSNEPMFRVLPAKVRPASKTQIERWPELASERERISQLESWKIKTVYLLWVKTERASAAGGLL